MTYTSLTPGDALRVSRRRKGWTQAEAATECGVHQLTYCSWENGHNRPRGVNLRQIAKVFDIDTAIFAENVSLSAARNFGAMIRRVREEERLSTEELASWLGRSVRTIEAWERGERVPNDENIRILERVLGRKLEIGAVKPAPIKLELITSQCMDAWRELAPHQQALLKTKMDAAADVVNELTRSAIGLRMRSS